MSKYRDVTNSRYKDIIYTNTNNNCKKIKLYFEFKIVQDRVNFCSKNNIDDICRTVFKINNDYHLTSYKIKYKEIKNKMYAILYFLIPAGSTYEVISKENILKFKEK